MHLVRELTESLVLLQIKQPIRIHYKVVIVSVGVSHDFDVEDAVQRLR